jgi:hypothetical protein
MPEQDLNSVPYMGCVIFDPFSEPRRYGIVAVTPSFSVWWEDGTHEYLDSSRVQVAFPHAVACLPGPRHLKAKEDSLKFLLQRCLEVIEEFAPGHTVLVSDIKDSLGQ